MDRSPELKANALGHAFGRVEPRSPSDQTTILEWVQTAIGWGLMRLSTRVWSFRLPRSTLWTCIATFVLGSSPRALAQSWTDSTLAPTQRANLPLSAMTQDEKLAMVHGTGGGTYAGRVSVIPRLGTPDLKLQDGPVGVRDQLTQVTSFPAPITLAATRDTDLAQKIGAPMGAEQTTKSTNVLLGPMMNIDRVPVAGLNLEWAWPLRSRVARCLHRGSMTFLVSVPAAGSCDVTARRNAVRSARTLSVHVNSSKVRQGTFPPLANPLFLERRAPAHPRAV